MPSITSFNVAHLHLLLNHVPTVGAVVAVGILLLALIRRDDTLTRVGLEVLFMIAVITMPAYMTGVAAYEQLRSQPDFGDIAARAHQDAALVAYSVTEFAGFIAWIALWQSRRRRRPAQSLVSATIVLSMVALLLMSRAATLGGEIHHPEIRSEIAGAAPPDPESFLATRISRYMVNSPWAWPAAETVHFLGLSLSFGVLLAVNLRILGAMRQVRFGDVHRLLPWGMLGFGANFITGMLFFVGQPGQYVGSAPYYWKIVFLELAGANFLYLTVFQKAWVVEKMDSSFLDKAMAVSSLVAWLAVLYCGRMLPFIGHAF